MSVQVQLFSTPTFQVHQIDVSWIWQIGPSALGPDTMRECHLIWAPDQDLTCNFSSTCTLAMCPGTEE